MLDAMRSNRKVLSVVLWIVIIAFMSTIFVVWGVGSNDAQVNYVAKVGNVTITYEEYRNFYDNTVQSMRDLFGESYDEYVSTINLEQVILDDLINRKLMVMEAGRLGVPATNFEIIEAIKGIPAFQTDGMFDPEQYIQVLNYSRLTPTAFEESIKESLLAEKFKVLVQASVTVVSDVAAMSEYNYRGTTANIDFFSMDVLAFAPKDNSSKNVDEDFGSHLSYALGGRYVDDEAIKSYFENNKDNYIAPAKIKVKYVVFDPKGFKIDNVSMDNETVEAYYAENIAKYTVDGKVQALSDVRSTIVKELVEEKRIALFRSEVLAMYRDILKAGNITAFNEKFPNKVKVYETSAFDERGATLPVLLSLPSFTKGLFSIPKTEISQVVENKGLTYLFEISEKVEAYIPSLDEIRAEVKENFILSESRMVALSTVKVAIEKDGFTGAAKKFKVKVDNSGDFRRTSGNIFTIDTTLVDEIFKAKAGDTLKNAYVFNNRVYGFKVNSVNLPKSEKFADEKEAIVSYIASIKSEVALASYVDALRAGTVIEINPTFLINSLAE